jgi:hypothetical protein
VWSGLSSASVQTRSEKLFVRTASLAVVGGGVALAALMHTPSRLPGPALGSGLLLFFERLMVVLAALLFVLVALVRGWRGELPHRLSERGAEWEPVITGEAALRRDLETIAWRVADLEIGLERVTATMDDDVDW